ncbi:hypothetical protein K2173_013696 [Erythroxylum novogranatense]|uniref:Catalase core domain-containing protein n=1 Tax=Erythroxylum novogranatense TaxID=1862640 RepID=A0AAV8SAI4_9ROSI|nr:hypothetical protein K2173_013696 [Erythroxylum novogranatense]
MYKYFCFDYVQHRPSSAYNSPYWTTNVGAPVWSNDSSVTVGTRGPILLEDYHLLEKLANFRKGRIPEQSSDFPHIHARGASAKGFFEVTHDISQLTCVDFLRAPGIQTPVIVHFSTVIHERGSPETLRDPRGFAVKFYIREGNFDLVGNNFPVFFNQDAMKFPDTIHAFKPNPKSHIQEMWRILDHFSHHPESLHMEGSSVHAYSLFNKAGKVLYCLMEDETIKIGGANYSHTTQDLYDSRRKFHEDKPLDQVILLCKIKKNSSFSLFPLSSSLSSLPAEFSSTCFFRFHQIQIYWTLKSRGKKKNRRKLNSR